MFSTSPSISHVLQGLSVCVLGYNRVYYITIYIGAISLIKFCERDSLQRWCPRIFGGRTMEIKYRAFYDNIVELTVAGN